MIIGMLKNNMPIFMQGIGKTPFDPRGSKTRINLQNAINPSLFYNETTGDSDISFLTSGVSKLMQAGILKTGGPDVVFNSATFSMKKAAAATGTMQAMHWSPSGSRVSAIVSLTTFSTSYTDISFTFTGSPRLFRIGDRIVVRWSSGTWTTDGVNNPFIENDSATTTTNYSLTTSSTSSNLSWTDDSTQSPVLSVDA